MMEKQQPTFARQFQLYLSNNVEFTERELADVASRRVAFRAFAFFVLVVGLPVWWVTTTPYRASLPHLEVDFARELEERLLSSFGNNGSSDVWDNLQLHSLYNVHIVFIHPPAIIRNFDLNKTAEHNKKNLENARHILHKIAAFGSQVLAPNGGIEIRLSAENLWDFSLDDLVIQQQQQKQKHHRLKNPHHYLIIDASNTADGEGQQVAAALATALDRLISAPLGPEPLLKIAVFFAGIDIGDETQPLTSSIQIMDKEGELTNGLAIASWGGICVVSGREQNTTTKQQHKSGGEELLLDSLMGILFTQFSIPLDSKSQNVVEILQRHRKRLTIHNLLKTVHELNALHELASKIGDLVISDEVAGHAAEAKALFLKSYTLLTKTGEIDAQSAATSRRMAELANSHHSLLELLNFPSDQKYGIYVPLFLPLLVPLLQPFLLLALFALKKFKEFIQTRRMRNMRGEKVAGKEE